MICEYCNKEYSGAYASGRFCNEACARGFSTKSTYSRMIEQKEYSAWVVERSVLYLYSIDWVYAFELESLMDLEARLQLDNN